MAMRVVDAFTPASRLYNGTASEYFQASLSLNPLFQCIVKDSARSGYDMLDSFHARKLKSEIAELALAEIASCKDLVLSSKFESLVHQTLPLIDKTDITVVFCSDFGSGAGWALMVDGRFWIQVGIESAFGLYGSGCLAKIVSHELGHVAHWVMRGDSEEYRKWELRSDYPIRYCLYSEGFAQTFSHSLGELLYFDYYGTVGNLSCLGVDVCELAMRIAANDDARDLFSVLENGRCPGYRIGEALVSSMLREGGIRMVATLSVDSFAEKAINLLKSVQEQDSH